MTPMRIGLLRLADSAPVVVAEASGLFAAQGMAARISVEPSWANIADKLAWGALDAAVMLPPLALAMACGLRGKRADLVVPMGVSLGGNSVVAAEAWRPAATDDPLAIGRALLDWLRTRPEPAMAVVHDFSTHNLLLRHWLAACGGDPDHDMRTVVVPPEQMVAALTHGRIVGFCAGAPWGDAAAASGAGHVLLGTSAIWPHHPEKCLAVAGAWLAAQPQANAGALRAIVAAQRICDDPAEADGIVALLAERLALPRAATRAALPGGDGVERIAFAAAAPPSAAHAAWFLGQMRRWGWLPAETLINEIAAAVYRPDLLAAAAPELSAMLPAPAKPPGAG